jgi:hypothetical protein
VVIFNSPDRYGKGLDWDGYTVHDAANVLRRYLNQLPEPIVPLDLYERFREPLRAHSIAEQEGRALPDEFDHDKTIQKYQQLITELPPLNRQLLLYILDLLAVFASKSDENRMTSQNLAAIFQPGMLSHPAHDMAPAEYRLSQDVLVFLIENQDNFLIGMSGTAADDKTVQDVQSGTPPIGTPSTPTQTKGKTGLGRSASNASAGADSLRRQGGVRRNVSVNSRHSRQSNGAPSPASPAMTPITSSGGVHRSNTVPSKRSPSLPTNLLQKSFERSPNASGSQPHSPNALGIESAPASARNASPAPPASLNASTAGTESVAAQSHTLNLGQSQDRLIPGSMENQPGSVTPTKERTIPFFGQRSPTAESEKRQPNKLRKKFNPNVPNSGNASAQSSANSLHGPATPPIPIITPTHEPSEYPGMATAALPDQDPNQLSAQPIRPPEVHRESDGTLKPQASSQSLHSRDESTNEFSDVDPSDDPVVAAEKKEKKHRWRLSRRKEENQNLGANLNLSPPKALGANNAAGTSATSLHSGRGRKSSAAAGEPVPMGVGSDSGMSSAYQVVSNDSGAAANNNNEAGAGSKEEKGEKKGISGWVKRIVQEVKEDRHARDAEKEKERREKDGNEGLSVGEGDKPRRPSTADKRKSAEVPASGTAA